jgi:hypothetical protein
MHQVEGLVNEIFINFLPNSKHVFAYVQLLFCPLFF